MFFSNIDFIKFFFYNKLISLHFQSLKLYLHQFSMKTSKCLESPHSTVMYPIIPTT